jgi:hypothetical protein
MSELSPHINWICNGICPGCGKFDKNNQKLQDSSHFKCLIPITNEELRSLLSKNKNTELILENIILPEEMRAFEFRRFWHDTFLTWTFPPTYFQLLELSRITGFNNYLEIGAGTGLLARLMMSIGFQFVAVTDPHPGKFRGKQYEPYCEMEAISSHQSLIKYGKSANIILSCWALDYEYNEDFETLYTGQFIVHIGESHGGCTYFGLIDDSKWDLIYIIETPQWDGIFDKLEIYSRRTATN